MTNKEVVAELRTRVKPYLYVKMCQQTFSRNLICIEEDRLKLCTMREFLNKFGYYGDYNNWRLKEGICPAKIRRKKADELDYA